jgi:predicted anti-sigma-YlaC factor YlaD
VEPRLDTAQGALDCELARELISADADGELRGGERLRLATHLDDCPACEAYAQHVARLTRQVRLRAAVAAPDFVDRVMARSRPPRLGRGGWLRPALAWCGVLIAAQSIRPLVFGELDGTPTHVARHVGASALALGVGLLYAAWRPHRAFGLLPLVGALLATTLFGTVLDTAAGARSAAAETVHLAELVGMVLLWMVAGSPGWDRVTGLWPGRHARRSHRGAAPTTR